MLNLFKGEREHLGQLVIHIRLLKIRSNKIAHRFKKIRADDDIPMPADGIRRSVKAVHIRQIQENNITGMQDPLISIYRVTDGAVQNINDLIKKVIMRNDIVIRGDNGMHGR